MQGVEFDYANEIFNDYRRQIGPIPCGTTCPLDSSAPFQVGLYVLAYEP